MVECLLIFYLGYQYIQMHRYRSFGWPPNKWWLAVSLLFVFFCIDLHVPDTGTSTGCCMSQEITICINNSGCIVRLFLSTFFPPRHRHGERLHLEERTSIGMSVLSTSQAKQRHARTLTSTHLDFELQEIRLLVVKKHWLVLRSRSIFVAINQYLLFLLFLRSHVRG